MVHEEEKNEEDIPVPTPLSSTPFIQTSPKPFIPTSSPISKPLDHPPSGYLPTDIPLAVQYPLELLTFQKEMIQFYTEDDPSKRTFTSLHGFITPRNIDEYLKLKAKQVEYISKEESKGPGDSNLQGRMQHRLSKVRNLEDFARDLSKKMSNLPPNDDLQKELRKDFIELIMRDKPYQAYGHQFKDLPLTVLKDEANRVKRMKNDPLMRKISPNWKKFKKVGVDVALEY
ncbi:hypothetical protein Hanom_Chr01g00071861 [Helianthus anomalus]